MKKIFVVILLILIFSMKSCGNTVQEIMFLRGKIVNTISENSFLNSMKNSNFKFKELIFENDDEFRDYIENKMESKKISNRKNIISSEFLNSDYLNSDLFYINSNNENVYGINIEQSYLSYVFGIVSGMISRSNSVSIIYSGNLTDSSNQIISFMSGLKKVNLRAYDLICNNENIFDLSKVSDEDILNRVQKFLDNSQSDVVFCLDENGKNDIIEELRSSMRTVFTLNEFDENGYLKISYGYENLFKKLFEDNGNVKKYNLSISNNTINVNTDNLPDEVRNIVNLVLDKIISGMISIPSNFEELKAY